MTILIGLAAGRKNDGALQLGAMLARSSLEDVLLATVVPTPWPPSAAGLDEEFLVHQETVAAQAIDDARAQLSQDLLGVEGVVRRAGSVSAGLLELATEPRISTVCLGSSAASVLGRAMLGTVGERLTHGSGAPVAVATRGYRPRRRAKVTRVNVAVGRADQDGDLVARAAAMAAAMSARLRLCCFAVRPGSAYPSAALGAETQVADEWRHQLERDLQASLGGSSTPASTLLTEQVHVELGVGPTWADALQDLTWHDDDVLAVGTSGGPLSRFYLGSHAAKIVRNSPVPVVLIPRGETPG